MLTPSYCGDRFATYTNTESLCYIPETDILLYVIYTSTKKGKKNHKPNSGR